MSFVEDVRELKGAAGEGTDVPLVPVENQPRPAESPLPAAKRGSPLQDELDRVSQQTSDLSGLACRLQGVLRAVRGEIPHGGPRQAHPIPTAPKSASWVEGMRYFNACHEAVLLDLAQEIEELEALLAIVPRETKASSRP